MPLAVAETRPLVTVTTLDYMRSVGCCNNSIGPAAFGLAAWPANNLAIYVPIYLAEPGIVVKLWAANGAVAGNVDIGLYNGDTLARIVSAGSTAMAGASVMQSFDIADTAVVPGRYYLGFACSTTTTATFLRSSLQLSGSRLIGLVQQATALPLPDPMVPATVNQGTVPIIGLSYRVTI